MMKNRMLLKKLYETRHHPLDIYDVDIYARLCFKREGITRYTDSIAFDIQHDTDRNGALSPSLHVCVALRYFATGSMQNLVGDSIQIHKSTVFRMMRRVSLARCRHMNTCACMPSMNAQNTNQAKIHGTSFVRGKSSIAGVLRSLHFFLFFLSPSAHSLLHLFCLCHVLPNLTFFRFVKDEFHLLSRTALFSRCPSIKMRISS